MLNGDWMNSFSCDDCGGQFEDIKTFTSHRKYHFTALYNVQPKSKNLLKKDCPLCKLSACLKNFSSRTINNISLKKSKKFRKEQNETEFNLRQCRYCFKCKHEFESANKLLKHSKEVHGIDRPYECIKCDFSTSTFHHLTRHFNVHKDTKLYPCHLCPKKYSSKASLDGHLLAHSEVNIKSHDCDICGKKFPIPSLLKRHLRRHSDVPRKRPFKCSLCPKDFVWKNSLKLHMLTHTEERPYQCSICDKGFKEPFKYRLHMQKHNQIIGNVVTCEFCNKQFLTPYLLKQHIVVHDVGEGRFKCDICSKPFRREIHLNLHKITHTGDLPYNCKDCGDKFKDRAAYFRHKIGHKYPNNGPVSCEHCGKEFSTMYRLKVHIKIHTATEVYKCDICAKSFTRKQTLKDHLILHEGTQPFSCMHCGKKFLKQSQLKKHLDPDKNSLKPICCKDCSSSFSNKGCYEFHRKTHRKEYFCKICNSKLSTAPGFKKHIKRHAMDDAAKHSDDIVVKEEI